jgi:protein transport protein SEC24
MSKPIRVVDKEQERAVTYDSDMVVQFELVHEEGKVLINGQSEYSFGMWTRWMRTAPKYLPKKEPEHWLGRFATVKGNDSPRDRTLVAFVG